MELRAFKLAITKGHSTITFNRESFPYLSTARTAHDLADRLKRARPQLQNEVDLLQGVVFNSHRRLQADDISSAAIAQAWCDMNAAYQTLLDLRRVPKA